MLTIETVLNEVLNDPDSYYLGAALQALLSHRKGGGTLELERAMQRIESLKRLEKRRRIDQGLTRGIMWVRAG